MIFTLLPVFHETTNPCSNTSPLLMQSPEGSIINTGPPNVMGEGFSRRVFY